MKYPVKLNPKNKKKLEQALKDLLGRTAVKFSSIDYYSVPAEGGVYLITRRYSSKETPYYIGRSKNIRNRLKVHINRTVFKKYLIDQKLCANLEDAKNYTLRHCAVRWLLESDYKVRARMEGYFTAVLSPRCEIYEEH